MLFMPQTCRQRIENEEDLVRIVDRLASLETHISGVTSPHWITFGGLDHLIRNHYLDLQQPKSWENETWRNYWSPSAFDSSSKIPD